MACGACIDSGRTAGTSRERLQPRDEGAPRQARGCVLGSAMPD